MKDEFQQFYDSNEGTSIPSYSAIQHLANDRDTQVGISHSSALLNSDAAWGLRYMSSIEGIMLPIIEEDSKVIKEAYSDVVAISEINQEAVISEMARESEIFEELTPENTAYDESLDIIDIAPNIGTETENLADLKVDEVVIENELGKEEAIETVENETDEISISSEISEGLDTNTIDNPILLTEIKPKKTKKSKKFKLVDHSGISSYHQWLLSLKDADFEQRMQKQEEKARQKRIEAEARKSVTKSDDIISESLAEILASQGHNEHAKKMYAQLMQKYPQKSSYFAAKIDNI